MGEAIKVKEVRAHMENLTLVVKVVHKSAMSLHNGKEYAYAIVEDETGKIKLNLWRSQVEQVKVGSRIRVTGAFAHTKARILQISTWSKIETISH